MILKREYPSTAATSMANSRCVSWFI